MVSDQVHFLSVDGDTGEPLRVPRAKLAAAARNWRGLGRRLRYGKKEEDLAQAGWGVVFPEKVAPAVKEALEPLIRRRQDEAGDRFQELTYRLGQGSGEFRNRLRVGFGPVNPDKIPYYLLLVGDAAEIPHGFQAGLDIPHAVGRLCLESPEAYAAFAEAVCASERRSGLPDPKLVVFSPLHDDDPGTAQCAQTLASGLVEYFACRRGGQLERALIGRAATRQAFYNLMSNPNASVMVAAGHGVMYRSGHRSQERLQGAFVCADWSGSGAIQMDDIIEPRSLPRSVAGACEILFLFGCHTGGTPHLDSFDMGSRAERHVLAEVPFVARLPKALLERGSLAVIAHVDKACTDAFLWQKYGQVEVFQDCVAKLLDGHRVGYALEGFADRYAQIATEMLEGRLELGDDDVESLGIRLWTAYHDARGMVVLGDPAVRLRNKLSSY